jgi:hypothetical protein
MTAMNIHARAHTTCIITTTSTAYCLHWDVENYLVGQRILCFFSKTNVQYRKHKGPFSNSEISIQPPRFIIFQGLQSNYGMPIQFTQHSYESFLPIICNTGTFTFATSSRLVLMQSNFSYNEHQGQRGRSAKPRLGMCGPLFSLPIRLRNLLAIWRKIFRPAFPYYYGNTRPLFSLLYQPQMIGDNDYGAIGGMRIDMGNWSTRRKPSAMPLCPPQIPHDLTPGSNPGCRGGKSAINRLSSGTASPVCRFCISVDF